MIEVTTIRKRYDATQALDGLSLRVPPGSIFGLVGPNGAGKTTLIRILATLLSFEEGVARIGGCDVTKDKDGVKRQVGYMPDQPGIYQEMRVEEYLEFFAEAFKLRDPARGRAVARALERAQLGSRRGHFVEQLSLGMRQRLLLAKTMLHDPTVLLLDEPATGLDPLARVHLREQLRQFAAEGVTILISSHILSDLEDICSEVAFIAAGRNAADGQGESVLTLRAPSPAEWRCEIEVVGDTEAAAAAVRGLGGATLVEIKGAALLVLVSGGREQAAGLLRHLVTAGISVVRFAPRALSLEDRYRSRFTERPS